MSITYEQQAPAALQQLKLTTALAQLDSAAQQAAAQSWSYSHFLGPPGVGKTHLAIALGLLTAEAGHRVYFTTAIEMTRRLSKALAESKLHRELHNLTRPKLLIIDEVGYLQLDQTQASLFLSGDLATLRQQQRHHPHL
ncbi:MAG TPA: ATP-binding protein [Pyrinomonadaceae bacterium]|nr:ATP-binding protein [Pyrinomonadaceae bacterium]